MRAMCSTMTLHPRLLLQAVSLTHLFPLLQHACYHQYSYMIWLVKAGSVSCSCTGSPVSACPPFSPVNDSAHVIPSSTKRSLSLKYFLWSLWDLFRSPVPSVQWTRASPFTLTKTPFTLVSSFSTKVILPATVSPSEKTFSLFGAS